MEKRPIILTLRTAPANASDLFHKAVDGLLESIGGSPEYAEITIQSSKASFKAKITVVGDTAGDFSDHPTKVELLQIPMPLDECLLEQNSSIV